MPKSLLRAGLGFVVLLAAFSAIRFTARADPPLRPAQNVLVAREGRAHVAARALFQGDATGYTLHYIFSPDPTKSDYFASFTPDVKSIVAWATVSADGGAPKKQFTVDIQFVAPDGTTVDSTWYGSDTGTVTTYEESAGTFSDANVARKFVNIAGTRNAQQTGLWTVNYSVGDKIIASGNFTLAGTGDLAQDDAKSGGKTALENAGYTVSDFTELEGKSNSLFAFTVMDPASKDLYSSETTQQIVDGFAALRKSFPNSEKLYVFLSYDPRYQVAYYTDPKNVDDYLKSSDFKSFAGTISVDVFDTETQKYLGDSSGDFITKNFGAGNYQTPPNPPLGKSSSVGSVRVEVSPNSLPADGASKATVSVTVYDKRNQPIPDAEVSFELSASGVGVIRPRVTSTDETGQAEAVFTAGKQNGAVTITAKTGGASGTGVITLGAGSSDSAADNVISYLSAQGLNVGSAGFVDAAKTTAAVLVDLGDSFQINDISAPIIYGIGALRTYYPSATTLEVVIPYQTNYLVFPAAASDYDALGDAIQAAQSQDAKTKAFQDFLGKVFAKSTVVDRNGKQVESFKDFYNKDFSGQ